MSLAGRMYATAFGTLDTLVNTEGLQTAWEGRDAAGNTLTPLACASVAVQSAVQIAMTAMGIKQIGAAVLTPKPVAPNLPNSAPASTIEANAPATEPAFSGANAWQQRQNWITARLKEHLSQAVKQAELSPAQAADIAKRGPASPHWGTQIDTRFKQLVQNDPLLQGEIAVSPRRLPKGSGAPDVIDLRSKNWWDVTSTAEEFAKKPPKYGTQYGEGTGLTYGEP
jgi:hypothetical protein